MISMVAKRRTIASTGEEFNEVDGGSPLAIVLSDELPPETAATVATADGARREEVESKILAWEVEEVDRITSRCLRQKAVVDGREREQVEKANAGLKKIKRKLEEKRASAAEKMDNEVAVAMQKADERRAEAEGSRKEKVGKQPVPKKDVYQIFAEKVRDNKQLKSKWAIMQETRVEYFRGKDFPVFLRDHLEVKELLGQQKDLDSEEIINALLRKNLIVRCDRLVKTLRPGKKKLSSWPVHLQIHNEQVFSKEDAFFAWTFIRRRALWQTILSFLWPLVALAMCLFPVYPYQVKIVVLYSCAGALLFIVVLLLIRATIFGTLYIITGNRIWFFPNINAEETTFRELVRFWPKKEEGEPIKWTSRLFYAIISVLIILLLRHHAPDEAARARYQSKVSNIIDEMLEWSPKLALSGMLEKQPRPVFNASEKNAPMDESWSGSAEEAADHHRNTKMVNSDGVENQDVDDDDDGNVT